MRAVIDAALCANDVGYGRGENTVRQFTTCRDCTDSAVPSWVGTHDFEGFGSAAIAVPGIGVLLRIRNAASGCWTNPPGPSCCGIAVVLAGGQPDSDPVCLHTWTCADAADASVSLPGRRVAFWSCDCGHEPLGSGQIDHTTSAIKADAVRSGKPQAQAGHAV